jgi:hypothetical protein
MLVIKIWSDKRYNDFINFKWNKSIKWLQSRQNLLFEVIKGIKFLKISNDNKHKVITIQTKPFIILRENF